MDNINQLMDYGLTRHEANLYILLLLEGDLNGYEAAKKSGISKSNTYNALAGLADKGAAYSIQGETTKYTPVPIEEFCDNKLRYLEACKKKLTRELPTKRRNQEGYITIRGEQQIQNKFVNMLNQTRERVYMVLSKERLEEVRNQLEEMIAKKIKVVIITDEGFKLSGATIYYSNNKKEQIRLITDSTDVLTGDIMSRYDANCLYSRNDNLVEVFKDALANEIELLKMKGKK
ncbi:MAG: helix-turn-helix domain-containing protein [Anaerostipes sp.]|nr:helix-turn-helix domain-containing protein [Anaerostipes sp.]